MTSSVSVSWREHPFEAAAIAVDGPVDAAVERRDDAARLALAGCAAQQPAHIIGVSVSDTIAETTTAMVSVRANSRNMRPTRPVMNNSGMNTAISDTVSEMTVKPISRAPSKRRLERLLAVLDVADDVLDHHDGVVDDEAGADRQRHQRQVVEREAAEPHHAEGRDQRQRQRHAGDDGGADRAQEQQHHQRRPARR